ncbi:MAG: SDR family NAD(P)-dependent oxidoreductase [Saprospiraceae bacterium]|nr:SDR family NAD(P)-dependent oxidoreductase [Saprospiraceae bacterium]
MNRILLTYCHENQDLAQHIEQSLGRIGIPFEHIRTGNGVAVAASLRDSSEPMLLLLTDNFLKNQAALSEFLPAFQAKIASGPYLIVLADGVDENGQTVHTQIDRMVNALHYMTWWQNAWLNLSDNLHEKSNLDRTQMEAELDAARAVANHIGEIIPAIREAGYITWADFEANDFERFFSAFGLQDWHGQFRKVAHVEEEPTSDAIPPTAALPDTHLTGGLLTPQPIETPEIIPAFDDEASPWHIADLTQDEITPATDVSTQISVEEVEATIRDAWFWMDRGQTERGLELLTAAATQFPENEALQVALQRATPNDPPPPVEQPAEPEMSSSESDSYDLMGKMAFEKGDFLFAKYCWDRAAEQEPDRPGLYKKLGLMTAEHLRDYRETAAHYLQKALEQSPNDAEVLMALAQLSLQQGDQELASSYYQQAANNDPSLQTPENEASFHIETAQPEPPIVEPEPVIPPPPVVVEPTPAPVLAPEKPTLPKSVVLITGATSGIGRATAELFARKGGYKLILTGRRLERLLEMKSRLSTEYQAEVLVLPFDVRDQGAVSAALDFLPEGWQEVDILVNNAGLAKGLAPIHEGELDHWETMVDTNVKGLLYVTRCISPGMVARRRGHIVNICSSAGKEAYPNGNVYCATKFAVDALTKSMRFDLHKHNIRVSQVSPGHVEETEFALTRFDGDSERAKIYNDFQPLKSSDVAEVIYFMVTQPPHVNIQDVQMFATQQASATVIDRSGR